MGLATQPLARLLGLGVLIIGLAGGQAPDAPSTATAPRPALVRVATPPPAAHVTIPVLPPDYDEADTEENDGLALTDPEPDEQDPYIASAPAPTKPAPQAKVTPKPVRRTIRRVCRVTAYCDRGITASGLWSGIGQCAAPSYIPLGSTVYVPALGRRFVVTDRTHPRFRHNTVDIFIPTEYQCVRFGRKYLECEFTLPPGPTNDRAAIRRTMLTAGRGD